MTWYPGAASRRAESGEAAAEHRLDQLLRNVEHGKFERMLSG